MDIYNRRDLERVRSWRELTRGVRNYPGLMVVALPISERFVSLLLQLYGRMWEARLLSVQGEVILFVLESYIQGYSLLTSFRRGQFRRLWPAWTNAQRISQLKLLAEEGGW